MKHGHRIVEFKEIAGQSIRRFRFTNDEDFRAASIHFTDSTALNFHMELGLHAKVELLTLTGENITHVKRLRPAPVVRRRAAKK
jgi:hypothetical protein